MSLSDALIGGMGRVEDGGRAEAFKKGHNLEGIRTRMAFKKGGDRGHKHKCNERGSTEKAYSKNWAGHCNTFFFIILHNFSTRENFLNP